MKYKIPIKFLNLQESGYHIVVTASINESDELILLLDTGASNSVFDIDNVLFALIEKKELISENQASGFNANIESMFVGEIKEIRMHKFIGRIENAIFTSLAHVNNVYAAVEIKPISGIIGGDFLKINNAVIDYKKSVLVLEPDEIL